MDKFILHSQYKPMGDQPQAIAELTDGVNRGFTEQTLLGNKARSVVLVHNHVNGIPVPSRDDLNTTKAVGDFFQGVNVHLLDHLIYTDEDIFSMAQVKKFAPLFI